jgi:uncharacterized damage-inducible protein DinB
MFRTLFAYDVATWRRVWEIVVGLTPEQYDQPLPYSHGSIRSQMTHVTRVSIAWLMGLNGQPGGQHFTLDPADFAHAEALRLRWEEVAGETLAYVATLSDDQLDETLPEMMGPTWHVLYQLINHGTDHRAQVLTGLHSLGAPTFGQDLIFYLWFDKR